VARNWLGRLGIAKPEIGLWRLGYGRRKPLPTIIEFLGLADQPAPASIRTGKALVLLQPILWRRSLDVYQLVLRLLQRPFKHDRHKKLQPETSAPLHQLAVPTREPRSPDMRKGSLTLLAVQPSPQ
jgi:hypothetical protein